MTQRQRRNRARAEIVLNATQRRLLRIYQGESNSGLTAISGGDTMLCPALLFAGVSHRWDHDAGLAAYIARNFAPAEPYWGARHLKGCLLPEARAHREAALDPLLAKLPGRQRAWVQRLLEFNWELDSRKLFLKLKRWTRGLLKAAECRALHSCIWNLLDLYLISLSGTLRVYDMTKPLHPAA